jgi:predicted lipoprotein
MFKRLLKYFLGIIFIGFLGYQSLYFRKLSSNKASEEIVFDAKNYARAYVFTKILSINDKASDIFILIDALKKDSKKAFEIYGKAQSTSDLNYFFVKGTAEILKIDDEFITIKNSLSSTEIKIAIKYIFGNSARDCTGLISINDFNNTMDLNNTSEEINNLIRKEIIPPFLAKAKKGDFVRFIGAIELNITETKLDHIEVIPLSLEIQSSKP